MRSLADTILSFLVHEYAKSATLDADLYDDDEEEEEQIPVHDTPSPDIRKRPSKGGEIKFDKEYAFLRRYKKDQDPLAKKSDWTYSLPDFRTPYSRYG